LESSIGGLSGDRCVRAECLCFESKSGNGARGAVIAPHGSPERQLPGEEVYSGERADPLETFNQAMLTFNRKADDWVLHPVAEKWAYIMPQPARASFSRFFKNVIIIPRFANDLFQLQFEQGA
jgi:ABC-type transporter lipoprotein component MlaA